MAGRAGPWKPADAGFRRLLEERLLECRGGPGSPSIGDLWQVYCFSTVTSTMDAASEIEHSGGESYAGVRLAGCGAGSNGRCLVLAASQDNGRGREGSSWYSAPGEGLYITYIYPPFGQQDRQAEGVSLVVGIAVARALDRFSVPARLKWPNDVLADAVPWAGKKLAGILLESSARGGVPAGLRAGIGINVNQDNFPSEVPGVSMCQITGRRLDYFEVLCAVTEEVMRAVEVFRNEHLGALLPEWLARSRLTGRRVAVRRGKSAGGPEVYGTVVGISPRGGLLLDVQDEPRPVEIISGAVREL